METGSGAAGYWLQQGLNGLFLATLYAVLATAYALLQGITNRIILSFGDIATFGAFAAALPGLPGQSLPSPMAVSASPWG